MEAKRAPSSPMFENDPTTFFMKCFIVSKLDLEPILPESSTAKTISAYALHLDPYMYLEAVIKKYNDKRVYFIPQIE